MDITQLHRELERIRAQLGLSGSSFVTSEPTEEIAPSEKCDFEKIRTQLGLPLSGSSFGISKSAEEMVDYPCHHSTSTNLVQPPMGDNHLQPSRGNISESVVGNRSKRSPVVEPLPHPQDRHDQRQDILTAGLNDFVVPAKQQLDDSIRTEINDLRLCLIDLSNRLESLTELCDLRNFAEPAGVPTDLCWVTPRGI